MTRSCMGAPPLCVAMNVWTLCGPPGDYPEQLTISCLPCGSLADVRVLSTTECLCPPVQMSIVDVLVSFRRLLGAKTWIPPVCLPSRFRRKGLLADLAAVRILIRTAGSVLMKTNELRLSFPRSLQMTRFPPGISFIVFIVCVGTIVFRALTANRLAVVRIPACIDCPSCSVLTSMMNLRCGGIAQAGNLYP